MAAERPSRDTIFCAAVEIASAEDRAAYIARACGSDEALRAQVHKLVEAHFRAGSFLEGPAHDPRATGTDETASPEASGTEQPGVVLAGRYKLLEQIGEGGMGTVWLAQQTEPVKRLVAVKLIKTGMDSKTVLARFEAERQAVALMDHPNIAKVLDAGTTNGEPGGVSPRRPFFVMELVKGVPITKYCDEQRLTLRQRLELFIPVCQAVQHAHHKGIIHRDIKPNNVLVACYDDRPVPKVIDFGVAKATGQQLTEQTLQTGFGTVVGTVEYMSPEQASFNKLDVDTRSDIYSLGVLLYELLAGSPPFSRKELEKAGLLEVLRVIREQEPPKPSTKVSTANGLPALAAKRGTEPKRLAALVRGELDWIVMKALEKDRSRRYETANGFAMDVQRYLADEPVQACPPSAGYRFRKLVQRNKAAVAVSAVIAALLVVATAVSSGLAVWATKAERLAQARLESETSERERAVEAEREGKRQLVKARFAQARAGRWSRQPGQRFDGLRALADAAALARELGMDASQIQDLRDEAVACLALADVRRSLKEWEGFPAGSTGDPGFDVDLERYARSDTKGNIEVRQVEGDRLLARLLGQGPGGGRSGAAHIRFSPDGSLLAVSNWHQIPGQPSNFQVWDWRRNQVVYQPPFPIAALISDAFDFSPDGRRLALGQENGAVSIHEVDGWKETNRLRAGFTPSSLTFHPDGNRLAVASGQGGALQVWEVDTSKRLHELSTPGRVGRVAWHPDGILLAAGVGRDIHLWDGATGRRHAVLQGHQGDTQVVAFAAGGDLLVSMAWDGTSRLWDPWTGRELVRLAESVHHVSRDGRWLTTLAGYNLAVWELNPGRECRVLPRRSADGNFYHWDISSDGRWLVANGARCRLWDLARWKEMDPLLGPSVEDAKFHPKQGELFTSGHEGLYRWSFEAGEGTLRMRPAERLLPPGDPGPISLDRKGDLLAVVCPGHEGGAAVLNLKDPPARIPTLEHRNTVSVAMSPDGQWAATGTHNGFGVNVWDARTGKLEKELIKDERVTRVAFSPDGRWLLTATSMEFGLWEPRTWRLVKQFPQEQPGVTPRPAAFSPDGKVLALAVSLTTVQLRDTETWRPLARLQWPDTEKIDRMGFGPDGSQLLVAGASTLRVWDLRQIREQLREIGLDWDRPAYRPAPPTGDPKPVRVEVDLAAYAQLTKAQEYLDAGKAHARARRWPQAVEVYTKALELDPECVDALVDRGWASQALRQPDKAMADYRKALEVSRRILREEHLSTLTARNNLAGLYKAQGQYAKAEPLFVKTLEVSRRILGEEQPHTLGSMNNLAGLYEDQGQFAKAEPLWREALEKIRKRHGEASPPAAGALASLGQNLLQQQKYADAEPLLRECLAIREKKELDAWTTFNTKSMLGGALLGQKKFADAESLLLAGYQGMKQREAKIPKRGRPRLLEALERLVQLYDAREKKDQAAGWRKMLEAQRQAEKKTGSRTTP